MRHYHGTPMGSKRSEVAKFAVNRHLLIPFGRPEDLSIVADVSAGFIFDNGAFTAWRSGTPITDWSDYYAWCKEWAKHPAFDWALIPDVIDGSEQDNKDLIQEWDRRMHFPIRVQGVPVWHLHESLERLHHLCTSRWPIVALGSSVKWATPGTDGWWSRMRDAMQAATNQQGRPHCKLHGLRMLDPAIFTRLPLASADSTNCAQNGNLLPRFGTYKPPTISQRWEVIAARIEIHSSASRWIPQTDRQLLLEGAT